MLVGEPIYSNLSQYKRCGKTQMLIRLSIVYNKLNCIFNSGLLCKPYIEFPPKQEKIISIPGDHPMNGFPTMRIEFSRIDRV